jgi:3,4-dihydroxy 2-butanone 4-phosphate synthase/GTP cyclohydrolase II
LRDLGLESVALLTNNPAKVEGLRAHGIEVTDMVGMDVGRTDHNSAYLAAKAARMGHVL